MCFSGDHCRNRTNGQPYPTSDPLCETCLDHAGRDVRNLVFDYLDLAQLHEASLSQAINEKTRGSKDSPMLISEQVDALQQEIVHTALTWEYEIRVACRLSDPTTLAPLADWHTTISKPQPVAQVRPGAALQRAVTILAPRLRQLSLLPATAVLPTGAEDDPQDVTGWQAVHHLQSLHQRAKAMLGRTRRILSLHGTCPTDCGAQALYRQEPREHHDEPPVWCDACGSTAPYAAYEHFMVNLVWPAALEAAA